MKNNLTTKKYLAYFNYQGPDDQAAAWAYFEMPRPPIHNYKKALPFVQKQLKKSPKTREWKAIEIKNLYLI